MTYEREAADAQAERFCDEVNKNLEVKKEDRQSDLIMAIVVGHSMNRLMKNFKPNERNKTFNNVMSRVNKFLRMRERTNTRDFIFATEFERVFWMNVTDSYDKNTPIFAINVITMLYEYYAPVLKRYSNLSEKLMEKLGIIHASTEWDSKEMFDVEQNDSSFSNTYVKLLEPYSGIALRKSKFAGRLLHIKNNMIIDGIKIKDGF